MAAQSLAYNEAQVASNCKLFKGDLRSFRATEKQDALTLTDTAKTLFIYEENSNENWVESANDLDFVKSPISGEAYERVYFTGETEPRFFANDNVSSPFDATTDYYKLGIPAPTTAPTVTSTGGGSTYRGYVYAFVNSYGEEGPPSPVGSDNDWSSGYVTIDSIEAAPADRAIDKIYLYRTNASASGTAEFQFVCEATWFDAAESYVVGDYVIYSTDLYECTTNHSGAWNAGNFTQGESEADADLLSVFPKTNYDPPPTDLTSLVLHPSGSLCGISGNKLYMSEPYQPHAYPTDYIIAFDSTPVSIEVFGSVIVVATDGYPQYLVYGDYPGQMSRERLARHYPCTSKRGMVAAEDGVFYPSKEGLVFVSNSGADIVTKELLSSDEWSDYSPNTMLGVFYEKKYIGFDSVGDQGFVIDFQDGYFVSLTVFAHACYLADDGTLYLTLDDTDLFDEENPPANTPLCVSEWEGSTTSYLQYTWRSKRFILNRPTNFSAALIIVDQSPYDAAAELFDLATLNASLFSASLEGAIGLNAIGIKAIAGDTLYDLGDYDISTDINFKLYADDTLKYSKTLSESSNMFRLPGGYLSDEIYFEVTGFMPIRKLVIATSTDEL